MQGTLVFAASNSADLHNNLLQLGGFLPSPALIILNG
jgi:hypothetical protein